MAGIWHDLGKYRPEFQQLLRRAGAEDAHVETAGLRVTHSHAGALFAIERLGEVKGRVLAALIAGHHTGLPDLHEADGSGASLTARLNAAVAKSEYAKALGQAIPKDIKDASADGLTACPGGLDGFALWQRMLFSCLVDADFLDTEAYFDPSRAALRETFVEVANLKPAFDGYMSRFEPSGTEASPVNRHRAAVLAECREKGRSRALTPGFFRLTVPTGGGKTLSSLAFALEHALTHGKRRVIYAIPYTSIIEQTAQEFRKVFVSLGENVVLEHHSNLDVDERCENHRNRLAAENWAAPLIVTTNVQLFESLHAYRTSRCRKLNRLVNSIIVLDEAQMLPRDFLGPVLRTLRLLVAHYGVTVVLCTATQPALTSRSEPITGRQTLHGVDTATDLVDEPDRLFRDLRRVNLRIPSNLAESTAWPDLAERLRRHAAVLVIVNTRKHARDLFRLVDDGDSEHLSGLMCAAHRSAVIERVRRRLTAQRDGAEVRPLRVVSTSLVEAGVDLDFPVVYRALAGLDSIAQAAGRCNREGRMPSPGDVWVFVAPGSIPMGQMRQGAQATRELAATGGLVDPLAPATIRRYFDIYYGKDPDGRFDREGVIALERPERAALRTAAQKFRLIDDVGETVVVPYVPEGRVDSPVNAWLRALEFDGNDRLARRKLQRFTVNVPRRDLERMVQQGDVEERAGLWFALHVRYDSRFGLLLPDDHCTADDLHC